MRRWPTKAAKNKEALRFFKYPKTFPYYIAAFELRALLRTCRDAAHHSKAKQQLSGRLLLLLLLRC